MVNENSSIFFTLSICKTGNMVCVFSGAKIVYVHIKICTLLCSVYTCKHKNAYTSNRIVVFHEQKKLVLNIKGKPITNVGGTWIYLWTEANGRPPWGNSSRCMERAESCWVRQPSGPSATKVLSWWWLSICVCVVIRGVFIVHSLFYDTFIYEFYCWLQLVLCVSEQKRWMYRRLVYYHLLSLRWRNKQ